MNEISAFIREAQRLGWRVTKTKKGHLKLLRAGCKPIFGSGTPSDWRAVHNMRAKLHRATRP